MTRLLSAALSHRDTCILAGALTLGGLMTLPAHAQQAPDQQPAQQATLEEIVVTAQRRTEALEKTAASISVRKGSDLAEAGRFTLTDILQDVPGVVGGTVTTVNTSVTSGTDSIANALIIRGIQSNSGAGGNITSVPSTAGYYVDDIYGGVGGGYDINRVEILRGPQGTLYGRSATSGVVAIHTRDPDLGKFDGNASAEFGSYNLRHYEAAVNVPIVGDSLSLRVSGNEYKRDGYYAVQQGSIDTTEGRAKLLWAPTDNFSVLLGAALDNNTTFEGGQNATISLKAPTNDYTYANLPLTEGSNHFRQYWGQLKWDLGFATLFYLPAYRTWDSNLEYELRLPFLSFNQFINTPKDHFLTNELRLASDPGSKLLWQVGTLVYDNKLSNSNNFYSYPSGAFIQLASINRDTSAVGVFSEATYPVTDTWRVTAGVRYDYTKVSTDQTYTSNLNQSGNHLSPTYGFPEVPSTKTLSGDAGRRTFSNWTYKLRLEHDLSPTTLAYAMVSTGFSPGDLTITRNTQLLPTAQEIKAETLKAYELGMKSRFFDDALQINGDVYLEQYGGFQTAAINISPNPAVAVFAVLQGRVQSYGAEFDIAYQLTRHDRLGLDLGYTNARYVDKNQPVLNTPDTLGTFYGKDAVPGVPPLTANLTYDHRIDLTASSTLTLHGDARVLSPHSEGQIYAQQLISSPYLLAYIDVPTEVVADINATWAFANDRYSLTGYVRNVANNRYRTQVNVTMQGGPSIYAVPYDPRTFGVIANVRW